MEHLLFTTIDWFELAVFLGLLLLLAPIIGHYMARVFQGELTPFYTLLAPIEQSAYRLAGINDKQEMTWQVYLFSIFCFSFFGAALLFCLLFFQNVLPGNPQHFAGMPWLQALSTAISYTTKTSWQSYAGEITLSNTSQMVGLTVQNFASAAVSNSVLLVLIRGLTRDKENTVGNFWVDFTRMIVYVLLPLSILVAIILTLQGTVQSLDAYVQATTLENESQVIPLGPVASQVAIGQLGSNGEGFFNTGEAHPLANPSAFSNFLECFCILLLPASLTFTYAQLIHSRRQGFLLLGIMLLLLTLGVIGAVWGQETSNPILANQLNREGQETRFGEFNSLLWTAATTGTSSGSVNAMLTSLSPLAGGVALANLMLGELIFGGLGVGLCNMVLFVFLTVFLAGLMVGRTPEFLGKKIDQKVIGWIVLAIFGPGILIHAATAIALQFPEVLASFGHAGPHGFTELLYAFSSTVRNNGSAFASLDSDTPFFHITLSICMVLGRLVHIAPVLVIAGNLVQKRILPTSTGTLATDNIPFAILLFSVIIITAKVVYSPAFLLGPLFENLLMLEGRAF